MSGKKKIVVYLIGVALGLLILTIIPRQAREGREHPWHAQTAPDGTYPMEVEDYWGRKVLVERQPRYFISLAPSVTQVLFAMEMGDHLLAVTRWCDYPKQARQLRDAGAHIGNLDQPNRERIIEYRPDLVLGSPHTPREVYESIDRPPRSRSFALSFDSLSEIQSSIAAIGSLTGVPHLALRLIHHLRERERLISEALEPMRGHEARRVLFLLDIEDNLHPGWTAGSDTWVDEILQICHAKNLANNLASSWGVLSLEALVDLNPEVILIRDGDSPESRQRLREKIEKSFQHPVWGTVDAVRNRRIELVPAEYINVPGPRSWDALETFAAALWPEIFDSPAGLIPSPAH